MNSSKQGYSIFAPFFPNQQEENSRLGQNTNLFSWILNWAKKSAGLERKNPTGREKSHGTRKIPLDEKNSMGREKFHGTRKIPWGENNPVVVFLPVPPGRSLLSADWPGTAPFPVFPSARPTSCSVPSVCCASRFVRQKSCVILYPPEPQTTKGDNLLPFGIHVE